MTLKQHKDYQAELSELAKSIKFFGRYEIELYPFSIFFLVGKYDYDTIFNLMVEYERPKNVAATHAAALSKYNGTCYSKCNLDFIINLTEICITPYEISKVVHESMHGVITLFDEIGMQMSLEGQEAWCYFIDDIIEAYFKLQGFAIEDYLKHPNKKELRKYIHKPNC